MNKFWSGDTVYHKRPRVCDLSEIRICRRRESATGLARRGAAAAAALAASVSVAAATTLTYASYAVVGDQIIEITSPGVASGQAGEFQLATSLGVVDAWCIDAFTTLLPSGSYALTSASGNLQSTPALTVTQLGEIGALARRGDQLVATPPTGDTANDVGAAIQIAIWEVEYPTFSYSWSTPHAAADALAAAYYADATTGVWAPDFDVQGLVAIGPANQTLVAAAPEASIRAMTLIGFAALAWTASRRSRHWRLAHRSPPRS